MRIIADTNILVRAVVRDDPKQAAAATRALRDSDLVALTLTCLCEFVWVLGSVYELANSDIAAAIELLVDAANIQTDREAVNTGLAVMKAGGDFADGVIAYEGRWLGGEMFVSFDKQAVSLLKAQGKPARLAS